MLTPGGRTVWELTIRTQHYLKLSLWVFSLAVYAWQPDSSCNGHTKVLPKVNHLSSFTVFKWPSTTLPFSRLSELRSGTLAHLKACLKAPQLAVRSGDENWFVLSFLSSPHSSPSVRNPFLRSFLEVTPLACLMPWTAAAAGLWPV